MFSIIHAPVLGNGYNQGYRDFSGEVFEKTNPSPKRPIHTRKLPNSYPRIICADIVYVIELVGVLSKAAGCPISHFKYWPFSPNLSL